MPSNGRRRYGNRLKPTYGLDTFSAAWVSSAAFGRCQWQPVQASAGRSTGERRKMCVDWTDRLGVTQVVEEAAKSSLFGAQHHGEREKGACIVQADQIAEALVKGTILEGPFFDEPVRVLLARGRGRRVEVVAEGVNSKRACGTLLNVAHVGGDFGTIR